MLEQFLPLRFDRYFQKLLLSSARALAKVYCIQRDWFAVCTADCLAIRMHRAFNLPLTEFLCRQEGRCSGANPREHERCAEISF